MNAEDKKRKIADMIIKISGTYSPYNVFRDWVEMYAISITNASHLIHNKLWQQREDTYMSLINKYTKEQQVTICKMSALLVEIFEEEITDILGSIYMEAGCGSKYTGQFFTPFHTSEMMNMMSIPSDVSEQKIFHLNEPSCGGGAMVIAAAKVLKDRGLNYQKCMRVVAQDLDWLGVYMTYIQMSVLGINGVVVQGDTLLQPYQSKYPESRILRTPANMGCLI